MHLTQKQESLISQYLRDVSRQLDATLSDKTRERSLRQLQSRIYRDLESLRNPSISDDDVREVLRRAASAPLAHGEEPAPPPRETQRPAGSHTQPRGAKPPREDNTVKPVWLGVCAYNADRFGLETWMVRLAAIALGFITGPLALVCYLAAFGEIHYTTPEDERAEIDYSVLAKRVAGPFLVLIALRWGAGKLEDLIAYGHDRLLKAPLPPLGDWDWLPYYEPTYFYLACMTVIPLGVLSGLPLANAWGHSLKRLSQATVALYGVLLSFGLASIIVGIILDRVEAYMQ